jgi:hypothetical protein
MEASINTADNERSGAAGTAGNLWLYVIEAMASVGGTLLSIGIFFFMKDRFGWRTPQNFLLAAGQGIVYVPAALSAGWVTARFDPRRALIVIYLILTALAVSAWGSSVWLGSASAVAAALLAFTFVIGLSWPMLEAMVASGDAQGMARRVAIYNVVWPSVGWAAIAVEGAIIQYFMPGMFLIPAAMMLASALIFLGVADVPASRVATEPAPHAAPEPQLLRSRTLALWLSRTALPATYVVIYGLMPMMPFLPVMEKLPTTTQTAIGSVWLLTRLVAFVALALSAWWHTRPRALLWAAVVMLIAFFGMTLRPTHGASPGLDLAMMVVWQAVLGLALGMIYSASLYFGMVLSEGSTKHGGYHEALIGVGWVLGPAAGAATQVFWPGQVWAGIAAVGAVIAASVIVVIVTAVIMGRPRAQGEEVAATTRG